MKTEIEKPSYALSMRGINKTFPGVKALTSVNFEISKGEVNDINISKDLEFSKFLID